MKEAILRGILSCWDSKLGLWRGQSPSGVSQCYWIGCFSSMLSGKWMQPNATLFIICKKSFQVKKFHQSSELVKIHP